jgi:hypothetical protein
MGIERKLVSASSASISVAYPGGQPVDETADEAPIFRRHWRWCSGIERQQLGLRR